MTISEKESIYISELQKRNKKNPNLKFTLEDRYHWFLLRKHFGFFKGVQFNQLYKSNEFDIFYKEKENHFKEYKYIYNRLPIKKNKIEFRNDYLDQLEALKSKYTQSKFVEVLNNAMDEINEFHSSKILADLEKTNKPHIKTILDFIANVKNKEKFAKDLKDTFKTEIGIAIRAIIDKLRDEEMIIIVHGEYKKFVELLGNYFNRNIGSYNGIQNPKSVDESIKNEINKKLKPLITNHKKN